MGLVQFGGGVTQIRGSVAGNTFTRTKAGAIQRQRVIPTNPQTSFQTDQRSIITELTQAWSSTLTQSQRDAWMLFGENFPSTNKLVVLATPGISPGINNVQNKLRYLMATAANPTSPTDIETPFTTRYGGLPQVGRKVVVWAHFIRTTNGAVSSPLQASAIVESTV